MSAFLPSGAFSSQQAMNATGQMPKPGKAPGEKIPGGYRAGRLANFTPQQMELLNSLLPQLSSGSFLSQLAGGSPQAFEQLETPALKQFAGLQGNLASRFSQMGTGGTRSSGFQNTMNQASSDFAQQLQAQRIGLQQQALRDLVGLSSELLGQRPYENLLTQKREKQGGWGGAIGGGLGAVGGFLAGGPAGAMQGAQLGYGIGSAF